MASCSPSCLVWPKIQWPELVGTNVNVAKATIESENPNLTGQPIPCNNYRDQTYCCNRVWIDFNSDGKVCEVPQIG
ncbi:Protease inhibitor HPI [Acorus calamus]|uniref:Protease inhibitor HPI n=1 Tax=Acorus calamus TaxID=4465 RepID=A0AAV9C720_ACOCL|nr:Protease inhibitor HPI [Acorus calamus]